MISSGEFYVMDLPVYVIIIFPRPDDDDTEASIGCAKISSYFSVSSQAVKRHRFFEERSLRNVIEF